MKTVQHDDIQSLLGAYAIDAVEPRERALVEDHLPRCDLCRVEVDRHREVAGFLAVGASPISDDVPDTLWSRIETGIDADDTTLAPVVRLADHRRIRRTLLLTGSAAAILTLVVAFQASRISTLDSELVAADARVDELQQAVAAAPYEEVARLAAANPDATRVSLAGDSGLVMTAILLPDGTGILVPESISPLDAQHTYQLWAIQDGQVISAGVLGSEPGFVPFHIDPDLLDGLVITAEDAGGVPVSSQPAIAAWFPEA